MSPKQINKRLQNRKISNKYDKINPSFHAKVIKGYNKEKVDQEKRSEDDIAKGIVKFLVDIYDETGETVGLATILTMVRKIDQSV